MKNGDNNPDLPPSAEELDQEIAESSEKNLDVVIEIPDNNADSTTPDNYPPGFVICNRQDKIAIALCVIPTLIFTAAGMGLSIALLMMDTENKKTTDNENDLSNLINSFAVPLGATLAGGVVGLASAGIYRYGSSVCSFFSRATQVAHHTEPEDRKDYQPLRQAG